MPNLNDLITPQLATGYARETYDIAFPDLNVLDPLFPRVTREDNIWKWDTTILKDEPAISYRAFDTELPIGDRQGVSRAWTELPSFGKKKILTEEHRLRLEAIRRGGDYSDMITQIYDDIRNLVRGARNRHLIDMGALLTAGALSVTGQSINGAPEFTVSVNYNVPGGHFVTASPLWSNVADSDPLLDLWSWEQVYEATNNGRRPAEWLINQTVQNLLMRNDAFRDSLYGPNSATAPTVLTPQQINAVLQSRGIAPLRVVNAKATNEAGTKVDVIDQTKIVAVPETGLGNMAMGTTAEALGMIERGTIAAEEAPGIMGLTRDEDDPPRRFNAVTGVGMPVLENPSLLFVATVRA
jgi:hypothetical protein